MSTNNSNGKTFTAWEISQFTGLPESSLKKIFNRSAPYTQEDRTRASQVADKMKELNTSSVPLAMQHLDVEVEVPSSSQPLPSETPQPNASNDLRDGLKSQAIAALGQELQGVIHEVFDEVQPHLADIFKQGFRRLIMDAMPGKFPSVGALPPEGGPDAAKQILLADYGIVPVQQLKSANPTIATLPSQ